jgi:hypothetical protein
MIFLNVILGKKTRILSTKLNFVEQVKEVKIFRIGL